MPSKVWEGAQEHRTLDKPADSLIFGNEYGNYINPPTGGPNARTWWNSALKSAGLPLHAYPRYRHTAASLAVKSGAHVKIVQRMLGHKSAAITLDTYADLFEDDLETLIERLDSDIDTAIVAKAVATEDSEKD